MPARFSKSWPQAASDKMTFISEEMSAGPARMRGGGINGYIGKIHEDSTSQYDL